MSLASGVAGLVLAGGQSRRMGGDDKAFADLGGRPMLAHVLARLRGQAGSLVISANGDLARYERFGLPVVVDTVAGYVGPLAGVLAGMRWARAHVPGVSQIVSVSTDAPFFPRDLVSRLACDGERVIRVAMSAGRVHPVIASWPVVEADEIEAALLRGESKVQVLQKRLGSVIVEFPLARIGEELVDPFFNVNTPDELERARVLAVRERPLVVGIAGWKNAGKTTLVVRLVKELLRRGMRVATVKHSHHEVVDAEATGTDTTRHLEAGAWRVALVTPSRWGVLPVLKTGNQPALDEIVARLSGADIVLVEGYKRAEIPKIEVRGPGWRDEPELAPHDSRVIAIAADDVGEARVPVFKRDDATGMAELILALAGA